MSGVIRTEQLNVGYENKTVIRNVEIEAMRGQTICLIGPNGAGKSTILRTLSGMLAPVDGTVYIGQEDISKVTPRELSRTMAVVLTEKLGVNMTTAYEIVAMGRMPYTGFFGRLKEHDREVVRSCIQIVGAGSIAARNFKSLSDGEKQKVLIARALAQEPKLIILDEPTSHLDLKHKIEVMRILNKLSAERGLTVILALHDVDIAVKNCQFVLLVKDGEIVAKGRPEDVIQEDTITKLYDIEGANYDSTLGCMEICNEAEHEVYVAAGAGTGAPAYRLLSRMGIGVATGILYENDIDHAVAHSMKLTCVKQKSFQPIGEEQKRMAWELIRTSRFVVDTEFPVGPYDMVNAELLRQAAQEGIPVYSLRSEKELAEIYGDAPVRHLDLVGELQDVAEGACLKKKREELQ